MDKVCFTINNNTVILVCFTIQIVIDIFYYRCSDWSIVLIDILNLRCLSLYYRYRDLSVFLHPDFFHSHCQTLKVTPVK